MKEQKKGGQGVIDLTGQKFGRWTVVTRSPKKTGTWWHCRCECGTEKSVLSLKLRQGLSKSCGCLKRDMGGKRTFLDLAGSSFGRLDVIRRIAMPKKSPPTWECLCDCGVRIEVTTKNLTRGDKRSCGCLKRDFYKACSKGSGPVFTARQSLGLTQKEFGEKIGGSKKTVAQAERSKRSFRMKKLRASAHKQKPANPHDFLVIAAELCGYDHKIVVGDRAAIARKKRKNPTGKVFCNPACGSLYRHRGALPFATATTETPRYTGTDYERVREPRKLDVGLKKALREQQKNRS